MLDVLKAKISPEEHHRLFLQNITHLDLPRKFDLIIAPFRVFSHLIEVADQLSALEAIRSHLNPGGEYIMDLFVPDPALITVGMKENIDFEGEYAPGFKFKRTVQVEPDRFRQINHVTMGFSWETENGWRSEKWAFPMRYYFRYELEHLITRAGFQLKTMYGDCEKNDFTAQSKEYVIICSK